MLLKSKVRAGEPSKPSAPLFASYATVLTAGSDAPTFLKDNVGP